MYNKIFVEAEMENGERILVNSERVLYYACPKETYQQGKLTGVIRFDNGEQVQVLNDFDPFHGFASLSKPPLPPPTFIDRRKPLPNIYIRRRSVR